MVELTVNRFFETPLIRQCFAADFDNLGTQLLSSAAQPDGDPRWDPIEGDALPSAAVRWAQEMVALAERFSGDTDGRPPRHAWGLALAVRVITAGHGTAPTYDAGAYWSAILRISGDTGAGGEMIIEDPRMPMRMMHESGVGFQAEENPRLSIVLTRGDAVMMPGWLRCGIQHYRGELPIIELGLSLFAGPSGQS